MSHEWLGAFAGYTAALALAATASFLMLAGEANAATFVVHKSRNSNLRSPRPTGTKKRTRSNSRLAPTARPKRWSSLTRAERKRWRGRRANSVKTRLAPILAEALSSRSTGIRKRTGHRQRERDSYAYAPRCHQWWFWRRERRDRRPGDSGRRKLDDLRQPGSQIIVESGATADLTNSTLSDGLANSALSMKARQAC